MRIRYMRMIGDMILQYGCSQKIARNFCVRDAMEDLTWKHFGVIGSGSLQAIDSFGTRYFVIQYQGP